MNRGDKELLLRNALPIMLGVAVAVLLFTGIYVSEPMLKSSLEAAEADAATPMIRVQTVEVENTLSVAAVIGMSLLIALAVSVSLWLRFRRGFS